MLWRRFIPADNPEANDARLWRVQPGTKTKADCESEVKEYRALDPDKLLHDPAGRGYRIEAIQCWSTSRPHGPPGMLCYATAS